MKKSSSNWREVRTALGLTQKQVAEAVGVSTNYVWMIERGDNEPSPALQEKFDQLARGELVSLSARGGSNSQSKPPFSYTQDTSRDQPQHTSRQGGLVKEGAGYEPKAKPENLELVLLNHPAVTDEVLWSIFRESVEEGQPHIATRIAEELSRRKSRFPDRTT